MTDTLLDYDPNDTGEIARIQTPTTDLVTGEIHHIDDLGLEPTRNLAAERDRLLGEQTQNIGPYAEFSRPIRRPDLTGELPALIDVPLGLSGGNLAGPQSPPPPLPRPPRPAAPGKVSNINLGAAQPIAPWERVAAAPTEWLTLLGTVVGLDGELREAPLPRPIPYPPKPPLPKPKLRRSVPYVLPADRAEWSYPRHAAPAPLWTRLAVAAGLALTLGSVLGLAVLAVIR
jgi:hypothetical protein